jgi:hypothetical protein
MNAQEAIKTLANGHNDEAVQVLVEAVLHASEYGDPDNSLADWIANGEYLGGETVESIALEWDDR